LNGFPRWTILADGTILAPLYDCGDDIEDARTRVLVYRSTDHGEHWQLRLVGSGAGVGDEAALVETEPGRVLCLIRQAPPGSLLESWSDDGGRTWSQAVRTEIWGYPPHLLKLRDGRILCSYGHRRPPLGVQAVISDDGGRSWNLAHRAVLRDDGETSDLGYPLSAQLPDGTIFTVYYITTGGVTHVATTRWQLPW
jgi:predicted neuraminidase